MNPARTLYVHGRILNIVGEDLGAAVLEMLVDQSHDRDRIVIRLKDRPTLRFFYANGDVWRGD